MARGAQGRALLHRGDAVAALPLLVEARDFHASHRRYELARSRITVAACLRIQGRTHDALGELDDATAELRETRRRSVSYADATAAFLEYERARVLVEIGDGLDAYRVAMRALEICGRGAWPRLGILRTLAWAHRLLGDPRSAEACVEQMRALDLGDARELRERLIDEASGPPRSDGEVY
jgi:tetratricopeptide (TPR) repeat protein